MEDAKKNLVFHFGVGRRASLYQIRHVKWAGLAVWLAGSSKTAPKNFIFSIILGAKYSFYVKSIATFAPTFLGYNNSVLVIVSGKNSLRIPEKYFEQTAIFNNVQ